MEAYYGGELMNNQDSARAVRAGCLAAWSLAEHLPDVSAGIAHRNADDALRQAGDLINTHKHGGRKPGKPSGRVTRDYTDADGQHVTLEFVDAVRTEERDALDLLTACCDSWAGFLRVAHLPVEWP